MPIVGVCPVHGEFESRMVVVTNANVKLSDNRESCPVPGCGRFATMMEGEFRFDASGFATVISAPQWSRDALDAVQGLRAAAEALADPAVPEIDAYRLLEQKLDVLVQQVSDMSGVNVELVKEVRGLKRKLTRSKLASVLFAILFVFDVMNTTVSTVEWVQGVLEWASEVFEQGQTPLPSDVPAPPAAPDSPSAPPRPS